MTAIKYSTTAVNNTIKSNNIVIGNNTADYGPTSSTGFYAGITPPDSGYTIYSVNSVTHIPTAVVAHNDAECIWFAQSFGGTNIVTISDAINYFLNGSTGTTIANMDYPSIVTSGLTLNLDAGLVSSYPKSGSTWKDLSGNGYDGTLYNNTNFQLSNNGVFNFNGINDYIYIPSPSDRFAWTPSGVGYHTLTFELWVKSNDADGRYMSRPWNDGGQYNYWITPINAAIGVGDQNHSLSYDSLSTNEWHQIVYIITPTQHAVYIDGSLSNDFTNHSITNNVPSSGNDNTGIALMTLYPYGPGEWSQTGFSINGSVSTFKIYNRVLSSLEVQQNYNATKYQYVINDGLVAYLDADRSDSFNGNITINLANLTDYSNKTYNFEYDANSWDTDAAHVYYYSSGGYNNLPYKKMVKTSGGVGGSFITEHLPINIESGKTYTISCYMKANHTETIEGYGLDMNRESDNLYTVGSNIDLTTDWVRYSWTFNPGPTDGGPDYQSRQIIHLDTNLPLEVYWCGFQVEENSSPTRYVNNTRKWNDLSGNNGYGTMVKTPQFVQSSPSYFTFNVASTYWQIPAITMPSNNITLMGWCMQNSSPGAHQTLVCTSPDYQCGLKLMSSYHGPVVAWLGNSNGTNDYPLDSTVTIENDGLWHHLATTKNSTTGLLTIYVDGILKNSATAFTGTTLNYGYGEVGSEYHSTAYYYNGRISSIMIYDRDLSLTEIQQNHNLTKSRFGL